MTGEEATKIVEDIDGYVSMPNGRDTVCLDGWYSYEELQAISIVLKEKSKLPFESVEYKNTVEPIDWSEVKIEPQSPRPLWE